MAESIVKLPSQEAQGMDFLAFSFNGKHSWDDFHIYRTSDGDRYNENLTPTLTDKTAEVPGGDGMHYFGTTHKQRDFNISFAFDSLTEVQLRELKKWLNGKEMGDLWFQEEPYKVWTAKPTGNSNIRYIPFDNENGQIIYKGEGSVTFTTYWPYAHTPDYASGYYMLKEESGRQWNIYQPTFLQKNNLVNITVSSQSNPTEGIVTFSALKGETVFTIEINCATGQVTDSRAVYGILSPLETNTSPNFYFSLKDTEDIDKIVLTKVTAQGIKSGEVDTMIYYVTINGIRLLAYGDGKSALAYQAFPQYNNNYLHILANAHTDTTNGRNCGDLPTSIIYTNSHLNANTNIKIHGLNITVPYEVWDLEWDSKSGIVKAKKTATALKQELIPVTGRPYGTIPAGSTYDAREVYTGGGTFKYHYWYY